MKTKKLIGLRVVFFLCLCLAIAILSGCVNNDAATKAPVQSASNEQLATTVAVTAQPAEAAATSTTIPAADTPKPADTSTPVPATDTPKPANTPTPIPATDTAPAPTNTAVPATQQPAAVGTVAVHYIDVGQGDSILTVAPDGKAMLIDGGEPGSGSLQYLQRQGIKQLDLVVATHPHEDHIGGLIEILNTIPVAEVVTSGQPTTSKTYEHFLDAIGSAKARYREVRTGDVLQLGSLSFEVLHPTTNTGDNLNNQSVVLRMVYGQVGFLFVGDAEHEAEATMLASGRNLAPAILKVGHHGSRTASSASFLAAVKPQMAIYSAGLGNSYGHPHAETLAALARVGAEVYGTDKNGTVVVTSDGNTYKVATNQGNTIRAPPSGVAPTAVPAAANPIQPTPTMAPAGGTALDLDITSVTSPAKPGGKATLTAKTAAGANSTITVYYKSGPSSAAGLEPKAADASGNVTWTWNVGPTTTEGTWRIVVTASSGGTSLTKETTFVMAK